MSLFAHSFVCVYCALFALFSFFAFCVLVLASLFFAFFFHVPRNVKINWRNSWKKNSKKAKEAKTKTMEKKNGNKRTKTERRAEKNENRTKQKGSIWLRSHFYSFCFACFRLVFLFMKPYCFHLAFLLFLFCQGCFVWCFTMLACSSRNSLVQHTTLDNAISTWPSELLVACHCRVRQLLVASHCWLRLSTHSFRLQQFP